MNASFHLLFSPEWSVLDDQAGMITSQYGAYLAFESKHAGQLTLHLHDAYPDLTWTLTVDGQDKETVLANEDTVAVQLPAGAHSYVLTLNQWATGQVAFWRTGLIVKDLSWSGESELEPTLPRDDGKGDVEDGATPYITFVGDSIVAGECMVGSAHDEHQPTQSFPALVASAMKQPLNRIAYGGTGLTTAAPFQEPKAIDALWRVGEDVPRRRVHTNKVVVAYGLNDGNYGADASDFAFGLRVYLLELVKRFHGADFYLLTPWTGAFSEIFEAEAARFDCFKVIETKDWDIQTRPHHPDPKDHQKIANELLTYLKEEN
ncbi:lysophospholipase [Fructobacillus sp. M2-14]|uniref:Lysophospholipase n=1 Tax=Fructobacillus broussonetiae TaxID=2713173 RepID=A0ABS5QZ56_9LACO|nr:lysophospholipase [Fructobacillus broussonetiae]MBS9338485.1 lysophospholipase [Fructobacillus broussonetiae]